MVKTNEKLSDQKAAAYFRRLYEMNAVPIIIWDREGHITQVNDIFLSLLGYSRKDFEDGLINWKQMTPPDPEYAKLDEECINQLKTKTIALPYEKKYITKNGQSIRVRLYNAVIEPNDNVGIAIVIPLEVRKP